MTNTERDQINRRFAELVGMCWHERIDEMTCTCGLGFRTNAIYMHIQDSNPDFIANPTLVLKEMLKRKDWHNFLDIIGLPYWDEHDIKHSAIDAMFILDETEGLLVKAGIEWLEKEQGIIAGRLPFSCGRPSSRQPGRPNTSHI